MSIFTPPPKRLKTSLQSDGSTVNRRKPFSMIELNDVFKEFGPNLVVHGSCAVWFLCAKYNVSNSKIDGRGSDIDVFSDSLNQSAKITFKERDIDFLQPSQLNVSYEDLFDERDSMDGIDVIKPVLLKGLYEDELEDTAESEAQSIIHEKIRLLIAVIQEKKKEKDNGERKDSKVSKKLFF